MNAQTTRELYRPVNKLRDLCSFVVWSTGRAEPEDPPSEKLREAVIELRQVVADLVELVEAGRMRLDDFPNEKPGRRRTPKRKWKRKRPRQGGRFQVGMSICEGSSGSIGQPWAAGKEARLC